MGLYSMDIYCDYRDVDRYFDLKAESIMQLLGTVSSNHEIKGFHLKPDYMSEYGLAWVLYQWKVKILKPKQYARKLTFRTVAETERDFYVYRNYGIYDEKGDIIGYALSHWVAIDTEKRKLARIPLEITDKINSYGEETPEEIRIKAALDRKAMKKEKEEPEFSCEFEIGYYDVDANLHVNNAVYGRWIAETINRFDPEFCDRNYHSEFNVVYKKEKKPEGKVISKMRLSGRRSYHEIYDEEGNLLTLAEVLWTDRERNRGDYSDYSWK